jgi:HAE1 family hydrophobic/amphiphilic exporter-1
VELTGRNLEDLRTAAAAVSEALALREELWNVRSSFEGGPPELRVVLDRSLSDGLGIDLETVSAAMQASLDGRRVTVMSTGDEERDVVLSLPRVRRDQLTAVPLRTASGVRVQVGDIARILPEEGAREIFRRDQRRVAQVTARIASGSDYPRAVAAATAAAMSIDLPPAIQIGVAGEEEERSRTFDELGLAAVLAVLLLFMVLAGTFESLVHPLTVIVAAPLALIGVALVLVPIGRPIGVMEMLGLIVLTGVAVNDAILLVATARREMAAGMDRLSALARAASIRLRPILMTTATTVMALLPLAIGTSEAARLRSPLALTIIGGITTSTIASLLVIPCVYLLLDRARPRKRRV